jgi:hypothetical protein
MTPQEQQLITELFARLKQTPAQTKDADADQLSGVPYEFCRGEYESSCASAILTRTQSNPSGGFVWPSLSPWWA